MSSLASHNQLQKGLDAITRVVKLLNEKRIELAKLDEELDRSRTLKGAMEWEYAEFERTKAARQDMLTRLNLALGQAQAQQDAVLAAIAQLELEKAKEINSITAAQNSVQAMKEAKEGAKKEMSLYETLKARKMAEHHAAQADLEKIRTEMHQETAKLREVEAKIVEEETDIARRVRELDDKESGLVVRAAYLDRIEKRLVKYAAQLNINF